MTNDGQQVPTKRKESISLMCLESLDRVPQLPLKKKVKDSNIPFAFILFIYTYDRLLIYKSNRVV